MKPEQQLLLVPLSHLMPSRRNPRRVRPGREAHQQLVALIRSQGLLQPLVVRPVKGKPKFYEVIAGERRLRALREIHRRAEDSKIACIVRFVDNTAADAMSLGENFGRAEMHPMDEAEAFAKLATSEGKDANAIAAEFGCPKRYIRQRMILANLADPVKVAYRQDRIDTAIAEALAVVPADKQLEVWHEVGGNPRHADHVRNIIAHSWIDAGDAVFDLTALPESAVSRDLFGDRVLIERHAFMAEQLKALENQRLAMADQGWSAVIVGQREDVQDQLYAMQTPQREFDPATAKKLGQPHRPRRSIDLSASVSVLPNVTTLSRADVLLQRRGRRVNWRSRLGLWSSLRDVGLLPDQPSRR